MPEFKLNGKTYSGSTSYASAIDYTEADGSKTTVQDKISELDENISELNKNTPLLYNFSVATTANTQVSKKFKLPDGIDKNYTPIILYKFNDNYNSYDTVKHVGWIDADNNVLAVYVSNTASCNCYFSVFFVKSSGSLT